MTMTDPIADMLTRIRNAILAGKNDVRIPSSRMKVEIAKILKDEGYIKNFRTLEGNVQGVLSIAQIHGRQSECHYRAEASEQTRLSHLLQGRFRA